MSEDEQSVVESEKRPFYQRIQWAWLLTVFIILLAIFVFFALDEQRSAEIGEYISGFSSALAFLWLIVGLRSQATDLKLQRNELVLQRAALEKQAKELKNSSKFSSLSQIETILDRALKKISDSATEAKAPTDISSVWMKGMSSWNVMYRSSDAELVQKTYMEWLNVEAVARSYLASVALALKIYMEHHLEQPFDSRLPDEEFIYIYSSWANRAPYLSEHAGPAYMTANLVYLYTPGLKALQFGGMVAISKNAGFVAFKEGALEKMRDELIAKDIPLPEIAKGKIR